MTPHDEQAVSPRYFTEREEKSIFIPRQSRLSKIYLVEELVTAPADKSEREKCADKRVHVCDD